jgi:hypothetical protein
MHLFPLVLSFAPARAAGPSNWTKSLDESRETLYAFSAPPVGSDVAIRVVRDTPTSANRATETPCP